MFNIIFFVTGFLLGGLTVHYNPELGDMIFSVKEDIMEEVNSAYEDKYEKPKAWYDIF
ncbi:MAG: hypothetical protein HOM84_01500 [Thiotrichales bacterium]|jgi:hypothetical protein|nr:hypothetical protein [Thiotrichales bacterium]MBT3613579.1 hypothetical protein [Thiotrichales bacterium]MBT3752514.1 hypothetical protein [Thiotrichales bacterium]MBT3837976.1 hypothetical protein [Thiotrichales bacterium]MBT4152000.1 hypothetical protein [Thiotrichales bacterium]